MFHATIRTTRRIGPVIGLLTGTARTKLIGLCAISIALLVPVLEHTRVVTAPKFTSLFTGRAVQLWNIITFEDFAERNCSRVFL